MRRYMRVLVLCMVLAFFSALYVCSHLSSLGTFESVAVVGDLAFSRSASLQSDVGKIARQWPETRGPGDLQDYRHGAGDTGSSSAPPPPPQRGRGREEPMHLAVVACGDRQEETLTMLKSAMLLSARPASFHIFAEEQLHQGFRDQLDSWPSMYRSKFNYTIYPITFPGENQEEWKKLFKPCASQRLFLPILLKEVDSLIYVDTDILFLRPLEDVWALLSRFNSTQLAAMSPEHEEPRIAWYNRFARHPFYGTTGVNSGVMLMNLTRIRAAHFKNDMTSVGLRWGELLVPLYHKYKQNITWGDQDLINIVFHYNPENLYVFPCHWNFRPDHCIYGSNCDAAKQAGVFILHGNRGVFHDSRQPAFRAIYDAIKKMSLANEPPQRSPSWGGFLFGRTWL
ncbi:glucoside xylosyltransferase 1 isoform X2 [Clupea harengus]|uniref:UDP-D-xylose:beta-D-glucoside alpha-1,3-D-xylosyltransferase n=1 Tax=Clupea harengus TaxID=7950 RepID=A0A6P8GN80_CLUHA|nr:glucoside xylosyltransferase 1 isoform X2 [Clupea harengus]